MLNIQPLANSIQDTGSISFKLYTEFCPVILVLV
jgi:hypothetical protein